MDEKAQQIPDPLVALAKCIGYHITQNYGQRKLGPPLAWEGAAPMKGCEIFIGNIPRDKYEDELMPLFLEAGKIYEMRIMLDFSGNNRGFAFVTYTTREDAAAAIKRFHGAEIATGRRIGVVKSVDNCRLFVGGIPKNKKKEDILKAISYHVRGVVDVIVYKDYRNNKQNRGFAFVEFQTHRAAALARKALVPKALQLWGRELIVNWAEPEPEIDDEIMSKVKVLYIRNLGLQTTATKMQHLVETIISHEILHIKKIKDYAFIHFFKREHAELALTLLNNMIIEGEHIEAKWSKPVDPGLYKYQKEFKGNNKFNMVPQKYKNNFDYNNNKLRHKTESQSDEGFHSMCQSPKNDPQAYGVTTWSGSLKLPIETLEKICNSHGWTLPKYRHEKLKTLKGIEYWSSSVVVHPTGSYEECGPFLARSLCLEIAQSNAADMCLRHIMNIFQNNCFNIPCPLSTAPQQGIISQAYPLQSLCPYYNNNGATNYVPSYALY